MQIYTEEKDGQDPLIWLPENSSDDSSLCGTYNYITDSFTVNACNYCSIARWFNHRCSDNDDALFTQPVYCQWQDQRSPVIAFFAQRDIKSGEELTYDYNSKVPSTDRQLASSLGIRFSWSILQFDYSSIRIRNEPYDRKARKSKMLLSFRSLYWSYSQILHRTHQQ